MQEQIAILILITFLDGGGFTNALGKAPKYVGVAFAISAKGMTAYFDRSLPVCYSASSLSVFLGIPKYRDYLVFVPQQFVFSEH
jgi:hypothetical protein